MTGTAAPPARTRPGAEPRVAGSRRPAGARLDRLTGREGLPNGEIAGELFLSEATVRTHATPIFDKLGARDRVQAVVLAYEGGAVQPGRLRPSRSR